jgi:hypothetical protein
LQEGAILHTRDENGRDRTASCIRLVKLTQIRSFGKAARLQRESARAPTFAGTLVLPLVFLQLLNNREKLQA